MRALVTGATGFIGQRLLERLQAPVLLSRDKHRAHAQLGNLEVHAWEPMSGPPPAAAFDGVDVVFHLAGESVANGRWKQKKKQRILETRTTGTMNLVRGLERCAHKPRVLVCASAVGYYGTRADELLDESSPPGDDFLADVCVRWELAAQRAEQFGVRVANPRFGVVLGPGGGALPKMLIPFRLGIGGRLGSGFQWMPWVHLDDVVGLMLHAAEHETVRGPMNAVAPHPVNNRDFTQSLATAIKRPAVFPVPALALRLVVGEFAEVLLASQRVVPHVAETTGYKFEHPDLQGALREILSNQGNSKPATRQASKAEATHH
jgi:uncharacterized protein (TIGR01777 family)